MVMVTFGTSVGYCLANASLYVLALYLIPSNIKRLPRDNPTHISYRLYAAGAATVVSVLCTVAVIPFNVYLGVSGWRALGLSIDRPLTIMWSLLLTVLLMSVFYLGPIASAMLYLRVEIHNVIEWDGSVRPRQEGQQQQGSKSVSELIQMWLSSYTRMYSSTVLFRNLLFAPITEEVVYRAVIIATLCVTSIATVQQPTQEGEESTLLVINGIDGINYGTPLPWVLSRPVPMALFSTLFFGVAHAHHLVEKISNGTPVPAAMVSTIVQLTYTSIFGFIAAILFMRTGNIYCPIISHQICNLVGLPNLGFLQSNGRGSQSNEYACLYEYRHILMFLHAAGLVLFTFLLLPLTEGLAEVSLYWHRA